jgi:predicted TPR repeat methyltransferase
MDPLTVLKLIGRFPDAECHWRVLDVGCRTGTFSRPFASHGCEVIGIDVRDHHAAFSGPKMHFILTSLEEFRPNSAFDLVIARHILPFLVGSWDAKLVKVKRFMSQGSLIYLTAFSPTDGFANERGISTIMRRHGLKCRYEGHEHFVGPTYSNIIKTWDILGIVAEREEPILEITPSAAQAI